MLTSMLRFFFNYSDWYLADNQIMGNFGDQVIEHFWNKLRVIIIIAGVFSKMFCKRRRRRRNLWYKKQWTITYQNFPYHFVFAFCYSFFSCARGVPYIFLFIARLSVYNTKVEKLLGKIRGIMLCSLHNVLRTSCIIKSFFLNLGKLIFTFLPALVDTMK